MTLIWAGVKLATGGVKIYEICGSTKEIMEEPQVKGLAEKLKLCLKATNPSSNISSP
jgi:hypothetical protein